MPVSLRPQRHLFEHADTDRPLGLDDGEFGEGFLVEVQDAPRVGKQNLAGLRHLRLLVLGGLDLTGKAAVLKTAARERFGVRIPGPPWPQISADLEQINADLQRRSQESA